MTTKYLMAMRTLMKGCKGDDVTLLQRLLHIEADGVFGQMTHNAVVAFQRSHGLVPVDGVVGPKTWAALGVPSNKGIDPSVVYMPLNVHISKAPERQIKYLAIHFTAGSSSAPGRARSIKRVFEQRSASADFAVDDAEMVQFNPDLRNYYCWAVGDKRASSVTCPSACNRNTISIEICSTLERGTSASVPNHSGWRFTDAALANAARLAKMLMRKYGIPKERVVRHYDITGKLCPGIVGWNDGRLYSPSGIATSKRNNSSIWFAFKEKL